MYMKKILPIADPLINSYPEYADIFSIAGAHTKEYMSWVYNYYIQLHTPVNFEQGNRVDYLVPELLTDFPWIETNHIARDIGLKMVNIVDFAKLYIDHDFYVYALYDVSQIAAYKREEFFQHDVLLYGYDDQKEEFYFSDNYKHGKYAQGVASFREIENACREFMKNEEAVDVFQGFRCLKYKRVGDDVSFRFDKGTYVGLLVDYVEERNSTTRWRDPGVSYKADEQRVLGMGVHRFVQDYVEFVREMGWIIDLRGFYVFKEHRKILEKSLTYLLGENWKQKYPDKWHMLEHEINITSILLNLGIKKNVTNDICILDKIKKYLIELEEIDKRLFPGLINMLNPV